MRREKRFRIRKIWICLLCVALLFSACAIYVGDYYRADDVAIEAFGIPSTVEQRRVSRNRIDFVPEDAVAGIVFYPGGKVEYTAYVPLMRALAERGILCVLLKMPFNLAVLDMNAADGVRESYSDVEQWYIGGHSLGGSMAAYHVAANADQWRGLLLLGSYSSKTLSDLNLRVLSIYGSEDRVMNREKYDSCKSNLPTSFKEIIVEGGCHAYFGVYGAQRGDGTPTISAEEQIRQTASYIAEFILEGER